MMTMPIQAAWSAALILAASSCWLATPAAAAAGYYLEDVVAGKRAGGPVAEPSCEELRAMWRYSKRQSRAAETTNELPMYRDPFSYNIWETYPDRPRTNLGYRENYSEQPRSRGAGGAAIYGRLVHKAPAGSRLRNAAPDLSRVFEEMTRYYGTISRHPPASRRGPNFRHGGGAGRPVSSQVPQAGKFQHLKDIIRTERARQLQEQRKAEEMAARAAAIKAVANGDRQDPDESGGHFFNQLQAYRDPRNVNYDFSHAHYMSTVGDALSRGDQYAGEYMLR